MMSFSLPGIYLYYLPKDDLAPEEYERIISPIFAWMHIREEYEFDDAHDRGFRLVNMHKRPCNPNPHQPRRYGPREEARLKAMVKSGEVVMLSPFHGPATLFYIGDQGQLICRDPSAFSFYGAKNVLRAYANSVSRRDYRHSGGKPRPTRIERRRATALDEVVPEARQRPDPEQRAQSAHKLREITLTLGVFFDGTGNNAVNTENMLAACNGEHFSLSDADAHTILAQAAQEQMGISGVGANSYTSYYTNVYWLSTLYKQQFYSESEQAQRAVYIEGIGTRTGKPDSVVGMGLGIADTGVVAKTDDAVAKLAMAIQLALRNIRQVLGDIHLQIKTLKFDIFGFSRGAAAARHFANRIQSEDVAIVSAIREGLDRVEYRGAPAGKTRFIGLFDTVAAIGTAVNGLNPHSADTGSVNLGLRPGVAEKVFHLTAQHECRFNFALNSVRPAWPELALPGAHSDIGGSYLPLVRENLWLTRPQAETVSLSQPGEQTRVFRQALSQLDALDRYPAIAPLVHNREVMVEVWHDERMPQDRYGNFQKRSFAALSLRNRLVKNDWSKVALRVMIDAAQEAGVAFDPIRETHQELQLPAELIPLCNKAIAMGKATRHGQKPGSFSAAENDLLADYMHCSAHWNARVTNPAGNIQGSVSLSETLGFAQRPDQRWCRTVYNMEGKKQ